MDAAPHIFMRRVNPRTHTHLHSRPLLMTLRASESSQWIIWNFEHGRACLHKRTQLLKLKTSTPYFFAYCRMFIQNGFSNKVPAVTTRMKAAYKLGEEFNTMSNTILISTYSLALFSRCHIGVKSWSYRFKYWVFYACVSACMSVCVTTNPGMGFHDGSQSLAAINHQFFHAFPLWAFFLLLYPRPESVFCETHISADMYECGIF